ncbi:hypothetical protein ACLB6M_17765 [Enterobacter hormaechei]
MSNNPLIPQSKLPESRHDDFYADERPRSSTTPLTSHKVSRILTGRNICRSVWRTTVAQGANQYAPMTGVQALREAIADKTAELYGHKPDANSDITVTAGATEALLCGDNRPGAYGR